MKSGKVTSVVFHDFAGPTGTILIGNYLIEQAKLQGRQLQTLVVWCLKGQDMQWDRYNGFMGPIERNPDLVNIVLEVGETLGSNELTQQFIVDAFTTHPELDSMYVICGGGSGAPEGLRAIDRLVPPDDPDHVITCLNDKDIVPHQQLLEGNIDCVLSHPNPDTSDVMVKTMFKALILGQPVDQQVSLPMQLVTRDTMNDRWYGVRLSWPYLIDDYGDSYNWPILDTTVLGIETPTVQMRKELVGY